MPDFTKSHSVRHMATTGTEADIVLFSCIKTDSNPIHLDEEFASTTQFGGRIAHGMLTASFISAVRGENCRGRARYTSGSTLKFYSPIRIGDTVTARAGILNLQALRRRQCVKAVAGAATPGSCLLSETTNQKVLPVPIRLSTPISPPIS